MFSCGYGMINNETDEIIGVAVYGRPCFPQTIKGWLGHEDKQVTELHRLVMKPEYNHGNYTSFLLGRSIRLLKQLDYKMVISLADTSLHIGFIYQACNFKYYGVTTKKTDFYCIDGTVNAKGVIKTKQGVHLPRTRKHRYAFILDESIKIIYGELPYPKENDFEYECCNGTEVVHDRRYDVYYTCPKCTKKLERIEKND